jgi:excisionase family DNA binding protein
MVSRSPELKTEGSVLAYEVDDRAQPFPSRVVIDHHGGPPLTSDEAAEYIGFSPSWMRQSRMAGKTGPPFHRIGRSIRYLRRDLDQWLAQRRCVSRTEQPDRTLEITTAAPELRRGRSLRRRRRPAR